MCAASALSAARTSSGGTPSNGAAAAAICSATDAVCALPDLRSCGAEVIEIWRRAALHSSDSQLCAAAAANFVVELGHALLRSCKLLVLGLQLRVRLLCPPISLSHGLVALLHHLLR